MIVMFASMFLWFFRTLTSLLAEQRLTIIHCNQMYHLSFFSILLYVAYEFLVSCYKRRILLLPSFVCLSFKTWMTGYVLVWKYHWYASPTHNKPTFVIIMLHCSMVRVDDGKQAFKCCRWKGNHIRIHSCFSLMSKFYYNVAHLGWIWIHR